MRSITRTNNIINFNRKFAEITKCKYISWEMPYRHLIIDILWKTSLSKMDLNVTHYENEVELI